MSEKINRESYEKRNEKHNNIVEICFEVSYFVLIKSDGLQKKNFIFYINSANSYQNTRSATFSS